MTSHAVDPARRALLGASASAVALTGLGPWRRAFAQETRPLPGYAAWKDAGAMIVHSPNTIELRRSAMGDGVITPVTQLYVRNNLTPPSADILTNGDAWKVQFDGVQNPRAFTLAELKKMPTETVTMVLQCSGNGRGMFPSKPAGTPWQVGAAGCVMWTGIPVRDLVRLLGGTDATAKFLTGTGGEVLPAGVDRKSRVERSVPLSAMNDALVAWELNGQPIPLAHGGPVRLIVPGFTGVNSVKYIKRIAFTSEESDSSIQQTDYRMSAPDAKGMSPSEPSVWEMPPKSWINSPLPESGALRAGSAVIKGVAFGGTNAVKQVEVSTDGGATWKVASLVGPDLGRFAWREFVANVDLSSGTHRLASRVTDVKGRTQPEERVENKAGYLNTSWRDHSVSVTVA
ncbi:sulfite oxidase [Variovorax sp. dw_954]|uniref:SorT family sulfite dehydrogenase catalytic subunit n=1 Tax=Variovorax sp. dw_954 TaxID=2720078 RepID=UPI001BD2FF0C|nr:sulfite oxidase [Variovorax sp. dw_954]